MKIFTLFLAALLLLTTVGCAGEADKPSPENTPSTADEQPDESPVESTDELFFGELLTPIYDNAAVVEAYKSGDSSGLDEKQLVVLENAVSAIGEFYKDGMTEEEIIIAAHDWLVTTVTYDEKALLTIPAQTPDSENPYGVFTSHQAICMGYTTTFQLFMDMLGVESIVVRGDSQDEEHAWNMVKLDGEWYHVDCTWDDFVSDDEGRPAFHTYTLVPDYVMDVMHIWDHDAVPTATAEDRIYFKTHGTYAEDSEKCSALLKEASDNQQRYAELMLDSSDYLTFDFTEQYWIHDFGKHIVVTFWMA